MPDQTPNWHSTFQYATDDLSTSGDGYWLFAPMLDDDIELFQVSTMVVGEMTEEFATTLVTPSGVRRHATHGKRGETPTADQRAVRHADQFLLEASPLLTISSDAPDRVYRVQTNDPVNNVSADLRVTPATLLHWDIERSNYRTTLDSLLEGTITIDGTAHEVSTLCAFEHSSWPVAAPGEPPLPKAMPPFWHYEYIQWEGADEPFGTFLWHSLGNEGEKVQASEFHASSPAHTNASMYDTYEIVYKDIDDHDGRMLPGAWEVTATKGDETFSYRANVHQVMSSPPGGGFGLSDFVLDCAGTYRGPDGETTLRGRGRTEYIVISHNPADHA